MGSLISGVWGYVAGLLVLLAGIVGTYLKGRSDAKSKASAQRAAEQLAQSEAARQRLKTAAQVEANVNAASANDVAARLRDKYARD